MPACLLDCTDSRFLNNPRHDFNTLSHLNSFFLGWGCNFFWRQNIIEADANSEINVVMIHMRLNIQTWYICKIILIRVSQLQVAVDPTLWQASTNWRDCWITLMPLAIQMWVQEIPFTVEWPGFTSLILFLWSTSQTESLIQQKISLIQMEPKDYLTTLAHIRVKPSGSLTKLSNISFA